MAKQPFTRLSVTDVKTAATAVSDIYDKLALLQSDNAGTSTNAASIASLQAEIAALQVKATGNPANSAPAPATSPTIIPTQSIQGATGLAASPQLAFIPTASILPSNNPTVSPYAQDGLLFEYSPSAGLPGTLYRYSRDFLKWVGPLLGGALSGPHSARLTTSAAAYTGALFYETDTVQLYMSVNNQWDWVAGGTIETTHADRISIGTVNTSGTAVTWVSGRQFLPEWTGYQMWIAPGVFYTFTYVSATSGTLSASAGSLSGASFVISLHPSVQYGDGATLWETDRTVQYLASDAVGTVNVSGVNVTWVSGPQFDPYWTGLPVTINGAAYTWAQRLSPTTGTLTTSAGTHSAVPFTQKAGCWIYTLGTYSDVTANEPADLSAATDLNFLFYDTTKTILFKLIGSPFRFAYLSGTQIGALSGVPGLSPTDVGYKYFVYDYGHTLYWGGFAWGTPNGGFADGSESGTFSWGTQPIPTTYWAAAPPGGGVVNVLLPSGLLFAQPTPPLVSAGDGAPFLRAGTSTSSVIQAASVPQWDPAKDKTDTATTGISVAPHSQASDFTTTGSDTATTTATHTVLDAGHQHTISNANLSLLKPNDTNGVWMANIELQLWVRI